jgi:hypothetical protein
MDKSQKFFKSMNPGNVKGVVEHWYSSTACFDQKKYKESFIYLLKYIDANIQIPNESAEQIELTVKHGSVAIKINIDNNSVTIKAPFLKNVDGGSGLALMREISELNFSYLVLAQFSLEGNDFYISYKDNLENAEPYKMYALFEEICFCSDYYDDYFIDKFKASFISPPQVNYFSDEDKNKAWDLYQEIIKEGIDYSNQFDSQRFYGFSLDTLETAILKLDYVIAPQGILGIKLQEVKADLNKQDSYENISRDVKKKLVEMQSYERSKFNESMFHTKFFIPIRKRAEIPYVQSFFQNLYQDSIQNMANKNFILTGHSIIFKFYDLFYRNSLPNDIYDFMQMKLEESANKPWKDVADILFTALDKIMKLDPENPTTLSSGGSIKGIFGKISGLFKK